MSYPSQFLSWRLPPCGKTLMHIETCILGFGCNSPGLLAYAERLSTGEASSVRESADQQCFSSGRCTAWPVELKRSVHFEVRPAADKGAVQFLSREYTMFIADRMTIVVLCVISQATITHILHVSCMICSA